MNIPLLTRHHRRTRWTTVTFLTCVGLSIMGNVQAQWKVVDDAGNKHLQKIRSDLGEGPRDGNVNNNLVKLYSQQMLGSSSSAGEMAKDPEELLDANNPSSVSIGIDDRCPETSAAGIAQQQHQICQEMVRTELAQYKYSLQMYAQAKTRHDRLVEIEKERSNLKPEDQGKLQDNSNKLLALISLMEIDRQRHRTYMDAYAARLHYMHTTQDLLTRWALTGDPKKQASAWTSWVGDAALKVALDAAKTKHHRRD